jgi:hypothetical protein
MSTTSRVRLKKSPPLTGFPTTFEGMQQLYNKIVVKQFCFATPLAPRSTRRGSVAPQVARAVNTKARAGKRRLRRPPTLAA